MNDYQASLGRAMEHWAGGKLEQAFPGLTGIEFYFDSEPPTCMVRFELEGWRPFIQVKIAQFKPPEDSDYAQVLYQNIAYYYQHELRRPA